MRSNTALLGLLLGLHVAIALADFNQIVYCSKSVTNVKGNNGVFGCSGYTAGTSSFNVTTTKPSLVTVQGITVDSWTQITLVSPNGSIPITGSSGSTVIPVNGVYSIQLYSQYYSYGSPYGFTAVQTDDFYNIQNGVTISVSAVQPGGFVYFVLPSLSYGSSLAVQLTVNSYDGFQPPGLFAGAGFLPTLSSYTYYNSTSNSGSTPVVTLNVVNPTAGTYIFGAFLYGTSSSLSIVATWNFTFPLIFNGKKFTSSTSSNPNYQFFIPANTPTLTLRVSRQLPGGYVLVYVGAGYIPSANNYNYLMDTTQQSYIQLNIPNPNPSNSTSSYPGLYVLSFIGAFGQNAGYIFEASWGNSRVSMTAEQFLDGNVLVLPKNH